MKLVYYDFLDKGIEEFLSSQEFIENVRINKKRTNISIQLKEGFSANVVTELIYLYQNNRCSVLLSFDKLDKKYEHCKKIKYHADDMCCEYCYMGFIQDLFDNENVIAVKSNYSPEGFAFDIDFTIIYKDIYDEKELLKYIDEVL